MSVYVDAATIRDAQRRAAGFPLAAEERDRWRRALGYADARTADQRPARVAELRALLAVPDADDDTVLADAAELLAEGVRNPATPGAGEVYRRCRTWFDDDVAAAAPLLELFTGHHRDPEGGAPAVDPDLVRRLGAWLVTRAGDQAELRRAEVISGGFSRLMLDVEWSGGRGVFRIEQDGMFATEGEREVAVMRALRGHDYPVPDVLWAEPDPAVLGAPFFVMEHVAGAARTDDAGIDDMLRAVAQLHRLAGRAVDEVAAVDGLLAGGSAEEAIEAQLQHWHGVYRAAVPLPIPLLERGFAWLRANLKPTGPRAVVHGDPGPGNALQDERGVSAVIDWELAHVGDPAEDWAYLALIRGRRLGTPQQWKQRLASTVGVEYDESTWRAWEIFNSVKGACVNLTALDVFRRSARPTPDMLAIGVAVHLRFLARAVELIEQALGEHAGAEA